MQVIGVVVHSGSSGMSLVLIKSTSSIESRFCSGFLSSRCAGVGRPEVCGKWRSERCCGRGPPTWGPWGRFESTRIHRRSVRVVEGGRVQGVDLSSAQGTASLIQSSRTSAEG